MVAMTANGIINGWPTPRDGQSVSRYGACPDGTCLHSGLLHAGGRAGRCVVASCSCSPSDPLEMWRARKRIGLMMAHP